MFAEFCQRLWFLDSVWKFCCEDTRPGTLGRDFSHGTQEVALVAALRLPPGGLLLEVGRHQALGTMPCILGLGQ